MMERKGARGRSACRETTSLVKVAYEFREKCGARVHRGGKYLRERRETEKKGGKQDDIPPHPCTAD